jgi:hypothetical protein
MIAMAVPTESPKKRVKRGQNSLRTTITVPAHLRAAVRSLEVEAGLSQSAAVVRLLELGAARYQHQETLRRRGETRVREWLEAEGLLEDPVFDEAEDQAWEEATWAARGGRPD